MFKLEWHRNVGVVIKEQTDPSHSERPPEALGTISVREAKEEGDAIRAAYVERLTELIGPELTEELGTRLRPGRGWDA